MTTTVSLENRGRRLRLRVKVGGRMASVSRSFITVYCDRSANANSAVKRSLQSLNSRRKRFLRGPCKLTKRWTIQVLLPQLRVIAWWLCMGTEPPGGIVPFIKHGASSLPCGATRDCTLSPNASSGRNRMLVVIVMTNN